MNISIFGLGYVGVTTAACLAEEGHNVIGVDVVSQKVNTVNEGRSPIIENDIGELIQKNREQGRLRATTDAKEALEWGEMAFICVGTPSRSNGALDVSSVVRVSKQIGGMLKDIPSDGTMLLVYRSTVLPGTIRDKVIPALEEASGEAAGKRYDVVFHPEFLREGVAVEDFYAPPKIVVGEREEGISGPLWKLYENIEGPRFNTTIEAAEAVKYADNTFHAVKIVFANEMGRVFKAHGIDSRTVMDIFCQDTKLNISDKYLRPGFAFGGSCLPKDVRAITYAAKDKDVGVPMLDSVLSSNTSHIQYAIEEVLRHDPEQVGVLGLAFKPGTDDLRESPLVELAERLLGKGVNIKIYDENVRESKLIGANKSYIEEHLPHLSELLVPSVKELDNSDLIVIGHPTSESIVEDWTDQETTVIDLVGSLSQDTNGRYEGIAW